MDILTVVASSNPLPKTPFIDGLRWDYGPFLTFASRKGLLGKVPYVLRKPIPDLHIPYVEMLSPGEKEENESFYLSWFYFGLIAEFCGLNKGPAQAPGFSDDDLKSYRNEFYQQLIIVEEGKKYLNNLATLEVLDSILKTITEADRVTTDLIDHFTECLVFTFRMMGNIHSDVDERILLSISAVGELISATVRAGCKQMVRSSKLSGSKMGQAAIPWASEYNRRTSTLRTKMINSGWCPSEVERVVHAYQGLASICSLSALNRTASHRDHSLCTKAMCKAFQINIETYELSHVEDNCKCPEYEIMIDEVQKILRETTSYPVLRFVTSKDGSVEFAVEEMTPETRFVALSHVWADGLGNPKKNSIQQCQVDNLMTLLSKLQRDMEPDGDSSDGNQTYRLWIDTLCCPTELSGKLISLERIAHVYRDATHVLVLDSSIYRYSSDSSPAEILLRIFGTSSWMRRLWTLQEGSLSKSLCFQLADRTVRDYDLYAQLEEAAKTDTRMFQISEDIYRELQQIHDFQVGQESKSNTTPFAHHLQTRLWVVQWSLYFRSVTVPSDEPLCLATLLSLDIKPIAEASTRRDRMALLWQQLANRHGGIPPRIIFTEDNPIQKLGFRWAPLSLLGSSFESTISANARAVRFDMVNMEASDIGILTPLGLRVRFNGARLSVRPLDPILPLHPWEGVIKPREDMVYIKQEATGKWFRMIDAELVRAQETGMFSEERVEEWFSAENRLCNGMHQQGAALIFDKMRMDTSITEHAQTMRQSVLVHIQDTEVQDPEALHVHTFRPVIIEQVGDKEGTMVESLRHLAGKLAQDPKALKLREIAGRETGGKEWKAAKEEVRERMKQVCMSFWDATPQFAEAVGASFGPGMREWVWAMVPKQFSHDILLEDLPPSQTWIVD